MAAKKGQPNTKGPRCNAPTRQGDHHPCKFPAGARTPHLGFGRCWKHGGNSPTHIKYGERLMAEEAAARFGLEVQTTAEDALLGALWRAQGTVMFYRERVRALTDEKMVYGTEKVMRTQRPANRIGDIKGTPFLVEDTQTVKTSVNIWVTLLEKAERHLLAVAGEIARQGIEARRVQIAKEQGAVFFTAMVKVMARLGVPDDDPRLPIVVGEVIAELTGGPDG